MKSVVALALVALHYWVYTDLGSREVVPPRVPFVALPDEVRGHAAAAPTPGRHSRWFCPERETMAPEVESVLGATDYVFCDWVSPERHAVVNLYVGYHETQVRRYDGRADEVRTIHPPEHCLPGSGWSILDSRIVPITAGARTGEAKRFVIAKGDARQVVYFWYQSRGRLVARSHEVILYKFLDRALLGRSDGALVRFTSPIERDDVHSADAAIRDFAAAITPHLGPHLPD